MELPDPQAITVVFVFKEGKYFFLFIAIGTDVIRPNDHAYDLFSTINVQVFFSDFAGNLRVQKPNKAQTKQRK